MPWSCTERRGAAALTRRDCLVGALVLTVAGAAARAAAPAAAPAANTAATAGAADAELRAALNQLLHAAAGHGAEASAADRLDSLRRFDETALSPSAAIDLDTVRAGLGLDGELAAATTAGDAARIYALRIARNLGEHVVPASALGELQTEVTRLAARADQLLRALGLRQGNLGARFQAAAARPAFLFADDDIGRNELVAYMNSWLERARLRLPQEFADVPEYCLQVRVERMSSADEAAGKPGSRNLPEAAAPGAYIIDLRDMARRPRWTLPSVVHHELLPGHLLQLPLEAAAGAHALRLEYLRAWSEGWATYAEELAGSDGVYRDDPASELGLVHWLMFRALRGLADIGIHHAGWSTGAALGRLHELQGFPAYFAAFDADVARIVAEPGARAAEALAWLRLRALSGTAARREQRRAFHRLALQHGRQPFARLAAQLASGA
jgi:uncharacterized protein (DUF885 family)